MGKFKSSLFFNDLRWEVIGPFVYNGGIIDHHYWNFLTETFIFFVYQIQPLSKKNLKYVYKNIVWLDTRAS